MVQIVWLGDSYIALMFCSLMSGKIYKCCLGATSRDFNEQEELLAWVG